MVTSLEDYHMSGGSAECISICSLLTAEVKTDNHSPLGFETNSITVTETGSHRSCRNPVKVGRWFRELQIEKKVDLDLSATHFYNLYIQNPASPNSCIHILQNIYTENSALSL